VLLHFAGDRHSSRRPAGSLALRVILGQLSDIAGELIRNTFPMPPSVVGQDRLDRAFRLADAAIDTFVGEYQHVAPPT